MQQNSMQPCCKRTLSTRFPAACSSSPASLHNPGAKHFSTVLHAAAVAVQPYACICFSKGPRSQHKGSCTYSSVSSALCFMHSSPCTGLPAAVNTATAAFQRIYMHCFGYSTPAQGCRSHSGSAAQPHAICTYSTPAHASRSHSSWTAQPHASCRNSTIEHASCSHKSRLAWRHARLEGQQSSTGFPQPQQQLLSRHAVCRISTSAHGSCSRSSSAPHQGLL